LKNPPEEMVLLLQKETALRFISKPKTKNYSAISIKVQVIYNTEYLRSVPPDVFYPKPEVTSGIVKFTKKQNIPDLETREKLNFLTKTAFLKRRKKLINTIKDIMPNNIIEIFRSLNINENTRPEELSPAIYMTMTKYIH
jgi:16S rRNA (adenine1518-N6/adenine1519-N6)-dimethyltransferase